MEAALKHDLPWLIAGGVAVGGFLLLQGAGRGAPLSVAQQRKANAPYVIGGQLGRPATSYASAPTGGTNAAGLIESDLEAMSNEYDAMQQTNAEEYVSHQALLGTQSEVSGMESIAQTEQPSFLQQLGGFFGGLGSAFSGFFGLGGLSGLFGGSSSGSGAPIGPGGWGYGNPGPWGIEEPPGGGYYAPGTGYGAEGGGWGWWPFGAGFP